MIYCLLLLFGFCGARRIWQACDESKYLYLTINSPKCEKWGEILSTAFRYLSIIALFLYAELYW